METPPLAMPASTESRLLDAVPEPVFAMDGEGRVVAANAAFAALGPDAPDSVRALGDGDLATLAGERYRVEPLGGEGGARYFRLHRDDRRACETRALATYLDSLRAGRPALAAALDALVEVGWRWSFVTRFNPRMLKQVQVLFAAEHGEPMEPFDYRVEGTPCERVFGDNVASCRVFSELTTSFPSDPWIKRVEAQEYVGQVYSTREGVPLGHLFTISDRVESGREEVAAVVTLLRSLVSHQLQALSWGELVDEATFHANRDALTRVASRHAYQKALAYLDDPALAPSGELAVVWMDLDGLKEINDTRGHDEGDRMLITFAHHLGSEIRSRDSLFRVGGDEFVLLQKGAFEPEAVAARLARVAATLREHGFEAFGVSYGCATVAETGGSLREAVKLADRRMYEMKRRRAASDRD